MSEFIVLYFSALSFGYFSYVNIFKRKPLIFSVCFYFGIITTVLSLFLFSVVFKTPFNFSSQLTATLAFLLAIFVVVKSRIKNQTIEQNTALILHPIIILPWAYSVYFCLFSRLGYTPFFWDEFSHWALMPKQILLSNAIASPQIPFRNFITYPPGWPILLAYPLTVLGKTFDPKFMLWSPLLLNVGLIGVFFDFIRTKASKFSSWLFILIAIRLGYLSYYPIDLLIETPLRSLIIAVFAILALLLKEEIESNAKNWTLVGIFCGFGYLLKDSMISLLVPVLVSFTLSLRGRPSCRRNKLLPVLSAILPPLVCLCIWQYTTHLFPRAFVVTGDKLQSGILSSFFSQKSLLILQQMLTSLSHLLAQEWQRSLLILLAIVLSLFSPVRMAKQLAIAFGSLFIFYFFGLHWLYLSSFSEKEASVLASFDRYIGLMIQCGAAISIIILISICSNWEWFKRRNPRPVKFIFYLAFVVFVGAYIEQLHLSIHNINRQTRMTSIPQETKQLLRMIETNKLDYPSILLVCSAEDWTGGLFHVRYQSLQQSLKPSFSLLPGCWFEPIGASKGSFTDFVSDQEMDSRIQQAQIIWLLGPHAWVTGRLKRFLAPDSGCILPLESNFLIAQNTSPKQFRCIKKEN